MDHRPAAPARAARLAVAGLLLAACSSDPPPATAAEPEVDPDLGVTALPTPADPGASALIERAYELKQDGRNGAALAALDEACAAIARTGGATSVEYASCLDDRASVHLRMGRAAEAKALYQEAIAILGAAKGADPRLVHGVMTRLEELELMAAKGIACAEPAAPDPADARPYFPDVGAMQEALGALGPYVELCKDGAPEPVTVRVIVTGDGKAIRAEARGLHADTPLGRCVLDRLLAAFPKAKLPPFKACFRGFTYPYMVGRHESKQAR